MTDFYELRGQRFAGRASGENLLEWPNGRFHENQASGHVTVTRAARRAADDRRSAAGAGATRCRASGDRSRRRRCRATCRSRVSSPTGSRRNASSSRRDGSRPSRRTCASRGRRPGAASRDIRFHVTSGDWQESDQLLAGILTDFGSPTRAVTFGGRGEFDGVMTGAFRRPRVEGLFTGENLRAWDTVWGSGSGRIVVENSYVTVRDGSIRHRRLRDSRRRTVLARVPAPRRRRRDRRALPGHAARPRQPPARLRDRRLSGVGPAVRRVPPDRRVRAADRLRRDDHRAGHGLRASRSKRARRRCGSTGRASGSTACRSPKAAGTVTGAAFVGWDGDLFVQRDRPPYSGGRDRRVRLPATAPDRRGRFHRRRQRHVRDARATTSSSASAI